MNTMNILWTFHVFVSWSYIFGRGYATSWFIRNCFILMIIFTVFYWLWGACLLILLLYILSTFICLHTFSWFQVFLSKTNNLYLIIWIEITIHIKDVGWLSFMACQVLWHIIVGYSMPNSFLCKKSVLFQTIQFSMTTLFNCQKHFYFKLFSLFKQFQLSEFTPA